MIAVLKPNHVSRGNQTGRRRRRQTPVHRHRRTGSVHTKPLLYADFSPRVQVGSSLYAGYYAMFLADDPAGLFRPFNSLTEVIQGLRHRNRNYNTGISDSLLLMTDKAYDDLIGNRVDSTVQTFKNEVPTDKQLIEAWKDLYGDQAWYVTVFGGEGSLIFGKGIVSGTATKLTGTKKSCAITVNCTSFGWQAGGSVAVTHAIVASKAKCCQDLIGAEPQWVQIQLQAGGKVGVQIWINRLGISGGAGKGSPAEAKFVKCKITTSDEISPN